MDHSASATFGDLLRRYRLAAGLTQEELAEMARVSPRAISDLERGQRSRPWRETVQLLAAALQLEAAERAVLEAAARRGAPAAVPASDPTTPPVVSSPASNLPASLTRLIGRSREIDRVRERLLRADVRLLTLTGPGGVGKTRVALACADSLLDAFPDGVTYVALAPITDPALVAPTIAQTLGLRESPDRSATDGIVAFLRQQRALLVLDNFEQLLPAAGIIRDVLAGCARVKVLATSRAALRSAGEHELPLAPLGLPQPGDLNLTVIGQSDAVRLFVERAQAIQPDFALTDQTGGAIAEICRQLDGLPLAIELAAARTRLLSPDAMLARLTDRLKLLTSDGSDRPDRQQTMRGAVAWSYDLLSEAEQRLFRRLAICSGGFPYEAAEAVHAAFPDDGLDLLDGLESLVAKSLVQQEDHDGAPRFRMLVTTQAYGHEQLAANGELDPARRAHADYYYAWIGGTEPLGFKFHSDLPDSTLEGEAANLRQLLRFLEESGDATRGLRAAHLLHGVWYFGGARREGCDWLRRFLLLADATVETSLAARAHATLGTLLGSVGDLAAARHHVEEGVALARAAGDPAALWQALHWRTYIRIEDRDFAGVLLDHDEAEQLGRGYEGPIFVALYLITRGAMHRYLGDAAGARMVYAELRRSVIHRADDPWTRRELGYASLDEGNAAEARRWSEESLRVYAKEGSRLGQMENLVVLAGILTLQRQPERAARVFGAIAALFDTFGGTLITIDRVEHDRALAATRELLDPEGFASAYAKGRALTLEQAIAYALEDEGG